MQTHHSYIRRKKTTDENDPQNQSGLQTYLQQNTLKYDLTAPRSRKSDDWLITYTDMVTLLITLFIVMIAHATFTKKEDGLLPLFLENYASSTELKSNIGNNSTLSRGDVIYLNPLTRQNEKETGKETPPPDPEKVKRANALRQSVKNAGLSDSVEIEVVSGDIEVRINEKVLFQTADAKLFPQGKDFLDSMLPSFRDGDFDIIVEGHTDNVPINTPQYPSNWELSAARALSVVHYLEKKGLPDRRLQAVAYGKTRPVASNQTREGRNKNRRVQIVLR